MICKFCGNSIEDNSDFCFICGQKVEPVQAETFAEPAADDIYSEAPAEEAPVAPEEVPVAPAEMPVAPEEAPVAPQNYQVPVAAPVAPVAPVAPKKAKKDKSAKKSKASFGRRFFTALFAIIFLAMFAFGGGIVKIVAAVLMGLYLIGVYRAHKKAKKLGYELKCAGILNSAGIGSIIGLIFVCIGLFIEAYAK